MKIFNMCLLCFFFALHGFAEDLQEMKAFFQKNGYIWIKNFFSPEQADLLRDWADEMNRAAKETLALQKAGLPVEHSAKAPVLIIVPEAGDPLKVCRVEDMLTCYPELYSFIESAITPFLEELFEEPYVLFKDKLNFKWPGGGAFSPHQDFPAYENFAPREHVNVMVCIDPATLENGCLQVAQDWQATFAGEEGIEMGLAVLPYVIGGSKHGSIQPHYAEKISWLPLKTSTRDLVLFTSYVPHYSEPNQSKSSRRAMFFTYNKAQEGEHRGSYYHAKRSDPDNPVFHFGTPTKARGK